MLTSYVRLCLASSALALSLFFTSSSTLAANVFLGENIAQVKTGQKAVRLDGNLYGQVASGNLVSINAPEGTLEKRVHSVQYYPNFSTVIFNTAFSNTYGNGGLALTVVENQDDYSNQLGQGFGRKDTNAPVEPTIVWVDGNVLNQVPRGAEIRLNNQLRRVKAVTYDAANNRTGIVLISSDQVVTVTLQDALEPLQGAAFGNAALSKPVAAGARSVWVMGQPFQNLDLGDQFVLSSDGTTNGTNAETREVLRFRVLGNVTQIFFQDPLVNAHNGDLLKKVASTPVEEVLLRPETLNFQSNPDPIIAGVDDFTALEFQIRSEGNADVNINSIEITTDAAGPAQQNIQDFTAAIFSNGTQISTGQNFSADGTINFEGLNQAVLANDATTFELVVDTSTSAADSLRGSASNIRFLTGEITATAQGNTNVVFAPGNAASGSYPIIKSGQLAASLGTTIFSDILVANQTEVEIMQLQLLAIDDEIQITDLYFMNNLDNNELSINNDEIAGGDRVDFKLYNEAGQLIQTETMIAGRLQFELGNTNRIRVPKDGNTTVSVRVDVRDINDLSQTGEKLKLQVDVGQQENGFEAVTASTGSSLDADAVASGFLASQEFLILNTQMSLRHATSQPIFADPSVNEQEFYRFTVTADAADEVELAQVKLDVALQGMSFSDAPNYRVLAVKSDGTLDTTSIVATAAGSSAAANDVDDFVTVSFSNQVIPAGQSRSYALLFDNTQNAGAFEDDDDSVAVSFLTDNSQAGPNSAASLIGSNNIVWSDESDASGGNDFFNGYLIDQDTTVQVNQD